MITKETRISNNGVLIKKVDVYTPDEKLNSSALKKEEIVSTILDEEDQLNLLATLVEEYLLSVGYTSPVFTYAQGEFAKIRAVLNGY